MFFDFEDSRFHVYEDQASIVLSVGSPSIKAIKTKYDISSELFPFLKETGLQVLSQTEESFDLTFSVSSLSGPQYS